jgi:hypothetical protein
LAEKERGLKGLERDNKYEEKMRGGDKDSKFREK